MHIKDDKGSEFIIREENGHFVIKKIVDNSEVTVSQNEIRYVQKKLAEIQEDIHVGLDNINYDYAIELRERYENICNDISNLDNQASLKRKRVYRRSKNSKLPVSSFAGNIPKRDHNGKKFVHSPLCQEMLDTILGLK